MDAYITEAVEAEGGDHVVAENAHFFFRYAGVFVGVDLGVGGPALRVSAVVQDMAKIVTAPVLQIAGLIEMSGIPLVGQGVEQGGDVVGIGGIDIDDIPAVVVDGRREVEGGAQIVPQGLVHIFYLVICVIQRRKILCHAFLQSGQHFFRGGIPVYVAVAGGEERGVLAGVGQKRVFGLCEPGGHEGTEVLRGERGAGGLTDQIPVILLSVGVGREGPVLSGQRKKFFQPLDQCMIGGMYILIYAGFVLFYGLLLFFFFEKGAVLKPFLKGLLQHGGAGLLQKALTLLDDVLYTLTAGQGVSAALFLLQGEERAEVVRESLQNTEILFQVIFVVDTKFCQQHRELGLYSGDGAQALGEGDVILSPDPQLQSVQKGAVEDLAVPGERPVVKGGGLGVEIFVSQGVLLQIGVGEGGKTVRQCGDTIVFRFCQSVVQGQGVRGSRLDKEGVGKLNKFLFFSGNAPGVGFLAGQEGEAQG